MQWLVPAVRIQAARVLGPGRAASWGWLLLGMPMDRRSAVVFHAPIMNARTRMGLLQRGQFMGVPRIFQMLDPG